MKNDNKKKLISIRNSLAALGLAAAMSTMSGCNGEILDNNDDEIKETEVLEIIEQEETIEQQEEEKSNILDSAEVLKLLNANDKPFRLEESFLDENENLVYQEFGPEFYEKEIDGLKYLINAETKEVCLSGYNNLGRLCCLDNLQKENGGTDSDLGYSGYVLQVFYSYNGETLFSLYDFDDFTPLLNECNLYGSTSFKDNIFRMYYLAAYDPKYHGHDDKNDYAGFYFSVKKDDIRYFVDVNDFKKIIISGDFPDFYVNQNITSTGNAIISYFDLDVGEDIFYTSEDLVPTYSDVLQRKLTKKDEDK